MEEVDRESDLNHLNQGNQETGIKSKKFTKMYDISQFHKDSYVILKEYLCYFCEGVYHNPQGDKCDHIFCESCINIARICPYTNTPFNDLNLQSIPLIASIIDKQLFYCSNRNEGCSWVGKLSLFKSHLNEDCLKQYISCGNGKGVCNIKIRRENMANHREDCQFSIIYCEKCSEEFFKKDQLLHKDECKMEILECPQECGVSLERIHMSKHCKDTCNLRKVSCKYSILGCNFLDYEEKLKIHLEENSGHHTILMIKSVKTVQNTILNQLKDLENNSIKISNEMVDLETIILKTNPDAYDEDEDYYEEEKSYNESNDEKKQPFSKYPKVKDDYNIDEVLSKHSEENNGNGNRRYLKRKRNRVIYAEDSDFD